MKLNTKYNCRYIYNGVMFFYDELDVFNLSQLLHFLMEMNLNFEDITLIVTYSRNDKAVDSSNFERILDLRFGDEVS